MEPIFRKLVTDHQQERFGAYAGALPDDHDSRMVAAINRAWHTEELRSIEIIREGLHTCQEHIDTKKKANEREPTMSDIVRHFNKRRSGKANNAVIATVAVKTFVRVPPVTITNNCSESFRLSITDRSQGSIEKALQKVELLRDRRVLNGARYGHAATTSKKIDYDKPAGPILRALPAEPIIDTFADLASDSNESDYEAPPGSVGPPGTPAMRNTKRKAQSTPVKAKGSKKPKAS